MGTQRAARIADTARPGQVRGSEAARLMADDAFGGAQGTKVDVNGISGAPSVYAPGDPAT